MSEQVKSKQRVTENKILENKPIFIDIKSLIDQSKQNVAIVVNSTMTQLYWEIGKRINERTAISNKPEETIKNELDLLKKRNLNINPKI